MGPAGTLSVHPSPLADPTGFLGLSASLGNPHLSSGVSYYFTGETGVGVDVGVARNFTNSAGFVGYDFLRNQPVVSFGVTRTQDAAAPAPAEPKGVAVLG